MEEMDKETNEDLRVLVKVDMFVDTMNLTDQFEWDTNDPHNSPEEFAEGGSCVFDSRASVRVPKSLLLVSHPFDGTPIAGDELRAAILPSIDHSFRFDRTLVKHFTLQLNMLQEAEIERNERDRERELKRKRRQSRGRRGIVLPDRASQKAHQTAVGYADPGSVICVLVW